MVCARAAIPLVDLWMTAKDARLASVQPTSFIDSLRTRSVYCDHYSVSFNAFGT